MCSVVITAPRRQMARKAITNSGVLGSCTATTSPRATPARRSPSAKPRTRSSSSFQVMTWKELEERVLGFAEGLRRAGVARGDVVAVQLPNTPEFVIAFLAICRLGAVMTTLHMPYRGAEIAALARHSRAKLAICLPAAKEMFGNAGRAFAEIDVSTPL